ncbi:FUSC family protein [Synechococcus sp. CBW1108]|uniref:FUSC family protein n=1 Tax=Synechococcus sp. CBW1108 TaxID=1353147 RepID=UPI0018CFCA82|nr:FUSC family protein [Synechococcus sp. CBW1108]QPN69201.1 FUSC family protein [Synechococcus sp. CBW1108]
MVQLRGALVIALAVGLTSAVCDGIGLSGEAIAYGAVIAALIVRPDFSRWPLAIYPVLLVVVGVCMAVGVVLALALSAVPQVFLFGLVAALMQLFALLLPGKLRMLSGVVAVAGVLPLLSSAPSWRDWGQQLLAIGLGMVIATALQLAFSPAVITASESPAAGPGSEQAEPPLAERVIAGLQSAFFWRKLVFASLALAIGQGVGAVTPKYLYFGVVLLLNDSIGDTLGRVRDRMVGVSFGILMPLLVFNTLGIGALQNGLVMGGTAALLMALNKASYLRTALISSGVAFVGYGPLVAWYIPNRWMDYLMGCGLALAVGLLLFPNSALRRYNQLRADPAASREQLQRLLPAAREEARWLGVPLAEPLPPELSRAEAS